MSFTLARVVSAMVGRRACGGRGGEWSKARPQDLPTGLVGWGVWGVVPFEGPGIRAVALVASVPLLLVRVVADATSPRSAVVDRPALEAGILCGMPTPSPWWLDRMSLARRMARARPLSIPTVASVTPGVGLQRRCLDG